MNSVWLLWITYSADSPFPKRTMLDGVYASGELCLKRIDHLKSIDPSMEGYTYEEKEVII